MKVAVIAFTSLKCFFRSTCALVALSAINALAGGCAATRISLHLTEIPTFFEPPEPQTNSLDVDDVVGSRVYDIGFNYICSFFVTIDTAVHVSLCSSRSPVCRFGHFQ